MEKRKKKVPGKAAAKMLHIALPTLLLSAVCVLISYLQARAEKGITAVPLYRDAPASLLMCVLIIAFGTLLLDRFFPGEK